MIEIPYGQDYVIGLDCPGVPLISQADTKLFKTGMTIAAGDAKLRHRTQGLINIAAEYVAFTSGSVEPVRGETLTGATSGETCVVVGVVLLSGSWAGTDAAGALFVRAVSGVFQAENLNGATAGANCMTIGADFTAALMADVGGGCVAIPVTATESTTLSGDIVLADAAGAEWCSERIGFLTTDHPSAGDPQGCVAVVKGHTDGVGTVQSASEIFLEAAPQNTPTEGFYVECRKGGQTPRTGNVASYSTPGGEFKITLSEAMSGGKIDETWTVYVYADAPKHRARIAATDNIDLSATQKTSAQAAAAAALTADGITANGITKIAGHTLADAGIGGQGIGAA